ncbi:hypothetical protein BST97_06315 [Nonlabens spongiae]|uniref:Peptidase M56 domain-containing protein n=1 Tax=Nonlabens spongiae TaxID=331648 RepID=A0A1W6MJ41_9FLAO|nr:M56 family metallopeptidase [Nonlabens spongiae]ARN77638.1 hypothetical protein BST97_06315 [Nonlabens spongiae]
MEELATYLLKSAAVLAVFVFIYHFLLRRLTFFQANRFFLLFGLVASIIFPLIEITQTVYVSAPMPVETIPTTLYTPTAYVLEQRPEVSPILETGFDFTTLFYCLYAAIGLFFLGKIAIELTSLARLIRSGEKVRIGQFFLVSLSRKLTPFSFFHYICHSKHEKKTPEFDLIIDHEKVHARQWHSLDVIISNLYRAVFWFNPLAWWIKRQITENLEFIADAEAKAANTSSISYERTLLSVLASQPQPALANNFFTPSIKKRIIMLQKETSARWHAYKYALILPVIIVFLYSFNVVEKVEYLKSDNPEIMTPENRASLNSNKTELVDVLSDDKKEENLSEIPKEPVSGSSDLNGRNSSQRDLQDEILIIKITQDTDREQLDDKVKRLEELGVSMDLKKAKYKNGKLVHLKFTLDDGKGFTSKHDHDTSNGISAVCIVRKKNDDKVEWEVGNCSNIQAYGAANEQIQDAYIVMKDAKLHEKLAEAQVKLAAAQGRSAQINMDSTMKAFSLAAIDLDSLMMDINFQMEGIDLENLKSKLDSMKISMDLSELKLQFSDSLKLAKIRKQIDSIKIPEFTFKRADGSTDIIAYHTDAQPLYNRAQPIAIINGKTYSADMMSKLDENKIKSVSVLNNDDAIIKYGEKAENGVVIIDYDGKLLEMDKVRDYGSGSQYIIFDEPKAKYKKDQSIKRSDFLMDFSREMLEVYAKEIEDQGYELDIRTYRERDGRLIKLKVDFEGSTYTIKADNEIQSLTFTYYKDGRKPVMTSRSI